MDALYGAIVKVAILQHEPVVNTKLVRGGDSGFMAVVLKPGMRAMAVPVSVSTDAGGFILPGDHVDVLQARPSDQASGGGRTFVAHTLLQNIKVLAIDQNAQTPKNGGQTALGAVATLEVSPSDAEAIAAAKAQGEMLLSLRPFTDAGVAGSDNRARLGVVRIVRNGQASDVTVTP
jgi:pilus assembly protein CpaB